MQGAAGGVERGVARASLRLRKAARLVRRIVCLLGDETLAVEHVQVVLLRVRAVAGHLSRSAPPAGVAERQALEVDRGLEGLVVDDKVSDIRDVLPGVGLAPVGSNGRPSENRHSPSPALRSREVELVGLELMVMLLG